jgi:type II secretory pathway predicted ATPase ExeA
MQPYILHPLRVMLQMQTEHERIAAVLHDVVEDTHKLADNADNMELRRIANPTQRDFDRIREYEMIRALILGQNAIDPRLSAASDDLFCNPSGGNS